MFSIHTDVHENPHSVVHSSAIILSRTSASHWNQFAASIDHMNTTSSSLIMLDNKFSLMQHMTLLHIHRLTGKNLVNTNFKSS